ncbi:hypothetical protein GW932_03985 [archaeon]|nr:hypothetical protein [archaeon]
MAKVILDTNFILNCIRNKVDFYEELLFKGHTPLIPIQVIDEIKRLRDGTKALKFREEANLALKLIASQDYQEVDTPGKYVDVGLKKYCLENPEVVLATMDKVLKKSVPNRKLVIRNKKKLELQ